MSPPQTEPGGAAEGGETAGTGPAILKSYSSVRREFLEHPGRRQACMQVTERDLADTFAGAPAAAPVRPFERTKQVARDILRGSAGAAVAARPSPRLARDGWETAGGCSCSAGAAAGVSGGAAGGAAAGVGGGGASGVESGAAAFGARSAGPANPGAGYAGPGAGSADSAAAGCAAAGSVAGGSASGCAGCSGVPRRRSPRCSPLLLSFFPFAQCLLSYRFRDFALADVSAGVGAGVAGVPIGLSYALLAGMPPEHGLYNQLFYSLGYFLLGDSHTVCVGAGAIEALIAREAVEGALGGARDAAGGNSSAPSGSTFDARDGVSGGSFGGGGGAAAGGVARAGSNAALGSAADGFAAADGSAAASVAAGSSAWINASIGLSFFVGVNLLVMRLVGLSVVSSFLADSVVSGFSCGSALAIATTQVPAMLGLPAAGSRAPSTAATWGRIFRTLRRAHGATAGVSAASFAVLLLAQWGNAAARRRWPGAPAFPGSLLLVSGATAASHWAGLARRGVAVVGPLRRGFARPRVFDFDGARTDVFGLYRSSVVFALIYFLVHISLVRSAARERGAAVRGDQELLAVGAAAVLGSFFGCFPIGTSVARTAMLRRGGARTIFWTLPNAAVILAAITAAAPLLHALPLASLGALVLHGVLGMFTFGDAWRLLRLRSPDFLFYAVCCAGILAAGPVQGLLAGAALSVLWIVKASAFPAAGVLGRLPGTKIFRSVEKFANAEEIPGIKILHFDAALNFSNAPHFEKHLLQYGGLGQEARQAPESAQAAPKALPAAAALGAPAAPAAAPSSSSAPLAPPAPLAPAGSPSPFAFSPLPPFPLPPPAARRSAAPLPAAEAANPRRWAAPPPAPPPPLPRESVSPSRPIHQSTAESEGPAAAEEVAAFGAGGPGGGAGGAAGAAGGGRDGGPAASAGRSGAPGTPTPVKVVIIDASCIVQIDMTAIRTLEALADLFERHGRVMLFANWRGPPSKFLERAGFYDCVPRDRCFLSLYDAVLYAEKYFLNEGLRVQLRS